jgi:hypothetical protein
LLDAYEQTREFFDRAGVIVEYRVVEEGTGLDERG